jgi:threonine dehydrogenase-like Zn-dependent dehydrogenase
MPLNRIMQLIAPKTFEVATEPIGNPDAGQVLVRILACGVCASELHAWQDPLPNYPVRMGHEPVGVIEEIGADVTELSVGDLVTGRFGPAFADYSIVDQDLVVVVPKGIGREDAMGEPLGCVIEGRRRTPIESGDRVAIIGAGYMGLLMLDVVNISGAAGITVIDPRSDARTSAMAMGASEAFSPEDAPVDDGAPKFDVVVEASGTQAGLDQATALVREHGLLSILGFHQGHDRTVDLETWNWKAIDVVNAHVRRVDLLNDAVRRGLELVRAGRLRPSGLVTHRFELEDLGRGFEVLDSKPDGFIKAVVFSEPSGLSHA